MAIKRFFFEGARADVKPWGALEWGAPIPTAYVRIRLAASPGIERPSIQKFFDRNSAIQEFLRELQLEASVTRRARSIGDCEELDVRFESLALLLRFGMRWEARERVDVIDRFTEVRFVEELRLAEDLLSVVLSPITAMLRLRGWDTQIQDAYRESWAPWDAMHRLGTPWNNRRLEVTKALGVRKS